ncbi:MAG: hypothetical protein HYT98_01760 [Candidatus Sungbacteria bacterium]|nr:hypothetical protein [Candidatus Sungbacteria bacterium]
MKKESFKSSDQSKPKEKIEGAGEIFDGMTSEDEWKIRELRKRAAAGELKEEPITDETGKQIGIRIFDPRRKGKILYEGLFLEEQEKIASSSKDAAHAIRAYHAAIDQAAEIILRENRETEEHTEQ